MTNAQIKAFRQIGSIGFDFGPRLTITKTDAGWEARKDDILQGVFMTREGAKEILGAK